MTCFPLDDYTPDFAGLRRVILGQELPARVRFVELKVDDEIQRAIVEELFGERWIAFDQDCEGHLRQLIELQRRMGYDFVRNRTPWAVSGLPAFAKPSAPDTAALSRGRRSWVTGSGGIIRDWLDFHAIAWDRVVPNFEVFDLIEKHLPQGMAIVLSGMLFEMVLENLLGYEQLFFLSHDNPGLVRAVVDAWGERLYEFYAACIARPSVGAIFHGDDLGHKTGTLMSPEWLGEYVFPWLRRYAELAHAHGRMFWLHSCGNLLGVMDRLVDDVGIDAYHSYQDVIVPVEQFHCRFGSRVAVLGGMDVDLLARGTPERVRARTAQVLGACMARGRYCLGSGNSITNYVPLQNYLAMLEAGLQWRPRMKGPEM